MERENERAPHVTGNENLHRQLLRLLQRMPIDGDGALLGDGRRTYQAGALQAYDGLR